LCQASKDRNDQAGFKIKNYNPEKLSKLTLLEWWEQLLMRFFLFETLEPILQPTDDVMQKISDYEEVEAIAPGKGPKYEITIFGDGAIRISDALFSEELRNKLRDEILEKGKVDFKEFDKQIVSPWPRTSVLLNLYAKLTRFRPHELQGIIEIDDSNLDILDSVLSRALKRQTISIPLLATELQLNEAIKSYVEEKKRELDYDLKASKSQNKRIWADGFLLAYLDYCLYCQKFSLEFRDSDFIAYVEKGKFNLKDEHKDKIFGRDCLRTTKAWKNKVLNEEFLTRLLAEAILEKK